MPGPMSIPNGETSQLVKVVVGYDDHGKAITAKLPLKQLNGQQRVQLAQRRMLHTGKTNRKR